MNAFLTQDMMRAGDFQRKAMEFVAGDAPVRLSCEDG